MRTRHILVLILLASSSLVFAQQNEKKTRKLNGIIEAGYITGFGDIKFKDSNQNNIKNEMNGRLIKTIVSYKFYKNFRAGLGFGFQGGEHPSTRPLFFDFRASLKELSSPFIKLEAGYFLKDSKKLWHGGNFIQLGLGYQLKLSTNSSLILSTSINRSKIDDLNITTITPYSTELGTTFEKTDATINSLSFSLAIMF